MQNLLDQQQRLALQDKKLLEEYKSEIKDLKSLTTQSKPFVNEEVNDHNDLEESATQDQNKSKKWWPFSKRGREND